MPHARSTRQGHRIIEPMIALARCTTQQRIIVAGAKSLELMFELQRRGYNRVAATANCGPARGEFEVALVDWRQRTLKSLEATLSWLAGFIRPGGVAVVWVDPQKPAGIQQLRFVLERCGFVIEDAAALEYGSLLSARRSEIRPLSQAA